MMTILEIHRMSIHNGPGIRTMVHFKGCPLRCIWCSTPESQKPEIELGLYPQKCISCGKCLGICPDGAIRNVSAGMPETDRNRCGGCMKCANVCDTQARKALGTEMTKEALKKEILKDRLFYETSGGGVVFSGGEVMAHITDEFIELLRELNEENISIGIDTCGYTAVENFAKIRPYTDFFLWDLKQMDPQKHKKYTGVDNRLILKNLQYVDTWGKDIYIRYPVIRGYTDDQSNLENICETAGKLKNLKEVHLIPMHHMGMARYESLGMSDPAGELALFSESELDSMKAHAEKYGLPVRIVG